MADYQAPIKEMQFVLNELAGLSEIHALPNYEDASPDLVDSILEEAGKFASGVFAPLNWSGDQEGCRLEDKTVIPAKGFKEAYLQFVENGWNGLSCDPEYGGQGLPQLVSTAVFEMWHGSNMAFALCPMLTQGAIEAITNHASDELKAIYLEKMISGEWTGTMNLTEPNAGSDLSAIRSKAVPEGDHYRIYGQKIFITWGDHNMTDNIVHLVLARTPDAPAGVKGISLFVVPKFLVNEDGSLGDRNDAYCVSLEHKLGIHASPTAVMAFGDNDGAIGYLVGEENKGLAYMFTMMNHARLAVGLEGIAISERAYQDALVYAKERVQLKLIIEHPDVRRMLMEMKAYTEANRAVAYYTATLMDKAHAHPDPAVRQESQSLVDLLIPVVKGWSTEVAVHVTSLGVQIHGGMGYIEETGVAQHFRDARITSIYEGTTGIQANDLVGRKIGREQGKTAYSLLKLIEQDFKKIESVGLKAVLEKAIASLRNSIDWIVNTFDKNADEVRAGSFAFLKLLGIVVGGWQMAKAGAIAQERMTENIDGDIDFYQSKLATAKFYSSQILPLAYSLEDVITQGGNDVLNAVF